MDSIQDFTTILDTDNFKTWTDRVFGPYIKGDKEKTYSMLCNLCKKAIPVYAPAENATLRVTGRRRHLISKHPDISIPERWLAGITAYDNGVKNQIMTHALKRCRQHFKESYVGKALKTSKYRGVSSREGKNAIFPWEMRMSIKGDYKSRGMYATEKEAAIAFNEEQLKLCREANDHFAIFNVFHEPHSSFVYPPIRPLHPNYSFIPDNNVDRGSTYADASTQSEVQLEASQGDEGGDFEVTIKQEAEDIGFLDPFPFSGDLFSEDAYFSNDYTGRQAALCEAQDLFAYISERYPIEGEAAQEPSVEDQVGGAGTYDGGGERGAEEGMATALWVDGVLDY